MRAPCPDRQRPLTGRLLYFGGFLAPAFIAFAASARFSAHRFFVAAMILAIPSLLKRRFGFGALAGADGSDSPRILAHLAFCAIAIFRLEAFRVHDHASAGRLRGQIAPDAFHAGGRDFDRNHRLRPGLQRLAREIAVARAAIQHHVAGWALMGPVEDTPIAEARAQMETNFFGVLRVCRAALPVMREQRSGHIVNISSLGGIFGIPFSGIYSAEY